jgi:thiol-disulfide isomerase/thioredoxin
MAKMKRCPVCGSPVKVENLERHLKKVHPGEDVDTGLSKDEQKKIKARERRGVSRREGAVVAIIAIVIAVIIILALTIEPNTLVGKQAPHFSIEDVETSLNYQLPNSFYGEVVLLEFFYPDCGACQAFMPTMNSLYSSYYQDVTFISIDVNNEDTEQVVRNFKVQYSSGDWIYSIDITGAISKDYKVDATPKTFIVDIRGAVEGTVEYEHRGTASYQDIASELDRVLSS